MIMAIFDMLGGWTWWILGLALLAVEVIAPGFFFLWFGVAAILIGVSALLIDWPWQLQIVGFGILSVISAVIGRKLLGYRDVQSEDPDLNIRTARLKGRTFVLSEPITAGSGRMKVDDSVWRVAGPDMPAGAKVVGTGSDGITLRVEPA